MALLPEIVGNGVKVISLPRLASTIRQIFDQIQIAIFVFRMLFEVIGHRKKQSPALVGLVAMKRLKAVDIIFFIEKAGGFANLTIRIDVFGAITYPVKKILLNVRDAGHICRHAGEGGIARPDVEVMLGLARVVLFRRIGRNQSAVFDSTVANHLLACLKRLFYFFFH